MEGLVEFHGNCSCLNVYLHKIPHQSVTLDEGSTYVHNKEWCGFQRRSRLVLSMVCHVVALLNVQASGMAQVAGPANSIDSDVAPLSHTCCWPIAVIT